MTPSEFKKAKEDLGLTIPKLAKELGVCHRSVNCYISGEHKVPGPVEKLLRMMLREKKSLRRE